LIYKDL
jgi:hypothetical protein